MNIQTFWSMFTTLNQLRQRDHWTRQQLEAYQAYALHDLRTYVYEHSPFYQQFHRGLMNRPLHELPILTKALMMEQFDDLVTDRAIHLNDIQAHLTILNGDQRYLGQYWVNATSGSTGHPGIFLFNRAEWATVIASFARGQEWGGLKVDLRRRKMAVVASTTPHHMSTRVGVTVRTPWVSTLRLAATEPLPTIVQKLNDWQPEILVSYASMARILAAEQNAGRLHISPAVVFTSSEVLTDDTRQRIEAVWGKILFNEYAATETGGLAAECKQHHGMHLFEDLVIFEVVDEHNQRVPPGVYGDKLLITALFNRTQPLIRYQLNDSVRLAETSFPSERPFRLINGIQGRMEDVLYFPTTIGGQVAVHPNLFHQVMDTIPVSGWQVIQETDGLTVLISGLRETAAASVLTNKLEQALSKQGVMLPTINVQPVSAIPKSASGKAPLIKSNLSTLARESLYQTSR